MSDKTKIRIALQMARELEFEVDDAEATVKLVEKAIAADGDVVWIIDSKGDRHGIAVDKVAFIEIEAGDKHGAVGFG